MHGRAMFTGLAYLPLSVILLACSGEGAHGNAEDAVDEAAGAAMTANLAIVDPGHISGKVSLPAKIDLRVAATGCSNHPGPTITIDGGIAVAGIGTKLTLANNVKLTHAATVHVDANLVLVNDGHPIRFNKGGAESGVGGNPFLFLQLYGHDGKLIGSRLPLGRCNSMSGGAKVDFDLLGDLDFKVLTGECMNSGGPNVTLSGALALRGINAQLYASNNQRGTRSDTVEVGVEIVLLPFGKAITFSKQPSLGGVGGNPWIFLMPTDAYGASIGRLLEVGRCKDISK